MKGRASAKADTIIFSILGASLLGIGAVAIFGYLIDLPAAYRWGDGPPMAVQAALGFAILGMGILDVDEGFWRRDRGRRSKPTASAARCRDTRRDVAPLAGFWRQDNARVEQKIQARNASITQEIQSRIEAHFQPVIRIASAWEKTAKGEEKRNGSPRRDDSWSISPRVRRWNGWIRNFAFAGRWQKMKGRVSEGMQLFPDKELLRVLAAARDQHSPRILSLERAPENSFKFMYRFRP